jgi:hypothetical protein
MATFNPLFVRDGVCETLEHARIVAKRVAYAFLELRDAEDMMFDENIKIDN